jgi:hypothetical protein
MPRFPSKSDVGVPETRETSFPLDTSVATCLAYWPDTQPYFTRWHKAPESG